MTLFTSQEKQVVLFLICTLILGYGIKLYKTSHFYDGFNSVSIEEKQNFMAVANLAYETEKKQSKNESNSIKEKDYKQKEEIININTAEKKELIKLPKVGAVTAERIIRHRDDYGQFKTIDDLLKVKGIGPKTLEKMKPLITL